MIAIAGDPALVQGPRPGRVCCGRGIDHPLGMPAFRFSPGFDGADARFVGAAKCVVCKRTYMTPLVRVPARLMITISGPAAVQAHLVRWTLAWLQHEAGRPN